MDDFSVDENEDDMEDDEEDMEVKVSSVRKRQKISCLDLC